MAHTSVLERFRIFTVLIMVPLVAQCTRVGRAAWSLWGGHPYGNVTGHRAGWGKLSGAIALGAGPSAAGGQSVVYDAQSGK
ncbi:MAG: hypothetical protein EOO77_36625 [Oxalobacteraceae bacterium]|nr:MAG: hypothetical protein EOO77_36625 [Oxalobacteraceae bacterium]